MRANRLEQERAVAALAARQHGVVARLQLMDLGIGRGAISRWRDSGRLNHVHAGVFAVGHERLTVRGRWMAAVLTCRDGTLLSHGDAGALWDLVPVGGSRIHVTVPSAGTRRRSGLAVHETARFEPEERAIRDAIPVTSVPRTLLDLAESEPSAYRAPGTPPSGYGS